MALIDWGACVEGPANQAGAAQISCLEPLFSNVVAAMVSLAGVALFVMLIVGGYNFLFSAGDPKKLEQATHTITNAIIGLVVIISAYLILKTISVFTGVDVTQFKVDVGP